MGQYLNTANLADPEQALVDQEDKVAKTYEAELVEWLGERHGFVPTGEDIAVQEAQAYFAALPAEQQRIYAREVYFAELRAGGREYNDTNGPRFGSYSRGRNAIAALFREQNAVGDAIVYRGDILMYGGADVRTKRGWQYPDAHRRRAASVWC